MSKPKIFISYSRADQPTALKLGEDLQQAGFRAWLDTDLRPGEQWQKAIEQQLKDCSYVIVLLSDNAVKKRGFFQKELRVALDEARKRNVTHPFLIPVRLDDVSENHFPKELSYVHWADCSQSYEKGKDEVLKTLDVQSRNRGHFTLTLSAEIEDVDLDRLTEVLKELTGDASISIKRIKSGSLVAEIAATEEATKLLQRLFRDGDLRDLLGYPILRLAAGIEEKPNNSPKIFISHSHKQKDLVGRLVRVLEKAFNLEQGDIRCTSLTGYTLPIGSQASLTLRKEIEYAEVVVGIITPESIESRYVLFELGASWGFKKHTFPVLACGATIESLPGPLKELSCILLSDAPSCHDFLVQIGGKLSISRRNGFEPQIAEAIEQLSRSAMAMDSR